METRARGSVVTDRRTREFKRRLTALVAPTGAKVDIRHTGSSHLCATISWGEAHMDIFFGRTPSDFRAQKNAVAFVRRKLRSAWEDNGMSYKVQKKTGSWSNVPGAPLRLF